MMGTGVGNFHQYNNSSGKREKAESLFLTQKMKKLAQGVHRPFFLSFHVIMWPNWTNIIPYKYKSKVWLKVSDNKLVSWPWGLLVTLPDPFVMCWQHGDIVAMQYGCK